MTEYIERDIAAAFAYNCGAIYVSNRLSDKNAFPAADVAPVVHGRWVSVPHKLARVCSVCNRDEPYKFADIDADVYDYCPNCGARMDEVE